MDPVAAGAPMEDDDARGIISDGPAADPITDDHSRRSTTSPPSHQLFNCWEDDNGLGIKSDGPAAVPIADDPRRRESSMLALDDTDYSVNGIGDGEGDNARGIISDGPAADPITDDRRRRATTSPPALQLFNCWEDDNALGIISDGPAPSSMLALDDTDYYVNGIGDGEDDNARGIISDGPAADPITDDRRRRATTSPPALQLFNCWEDDNALGIISDGPAPVPIVDDHRHRESSMLALDDTDYSVNGIGDGEDDNARGIISDGPAADPITDDRRRRATTSPPALQLFNCWEDDNALGIISDGPAPSSMLALDDTDYYVNGIGDGEDDNARGIISDGPAADPITDDRRRRATTPPPSLQLFNCWEDDNALGIISDGPAPVPIADDHRHRESSMLALDDTDYSENGIGDGEDDNARGIISDGPAADPITDDHSRRATTSPPALQLFNCWEDDNALGIISDGPAPSSMLALDDTDYSVNGIGDGEDDNARGIISDGPAADPITDDRRRRATTSPPALQLFNCWEDDNALGIISDGPAADPITNDHRCRDDNALGIISDGPAAVPIADDHRRRGTSSPPSLQLFDCCEDDNALGIIGSGPAADPFADDPRRRGESSMLALDDTDYSVNGIGDGESSDCHQVHAGESSRGDLYDEESSDGFDVYELIGRDLRRALNFGEPSSSRGSDDLESSVPPSVEPPASVAYPSLFYSYPSDVASTDSQDRLPSHSVPDAAYYYDIFCPHLNPYPSSRYYISRPRAKELVRQSLLYYESIDLSAVMATSSCFLCSGRPIVTREVQEQPPCSRCFQEFLDGREPEITQKVLAGFLRCSVYDMMMDCRGSDFILKLLHVADDVQRRQMEDYVRKDHRMLLKVAKDSSGSECVKELVKILKFPVGKALKCHVKQLMTCKNGKSVVDCCLEHLNYEANKVFIQAALDSFTDLASDKCGCLALVSCMDYSTNPHRNLLLKKTTAGALALSCHIYGNYVVQCALNMNVAWAAETICADLAGSLMELSVHKNGSYVVQRCLESSGRHHIIRGLDCLSQGDLEDMLQHYYANYVLKTALAFFKVKPLSPHNPSLAPLKLSLTAIFLQRGCPFYRRLLDRLERLVIPYKNHIHASNVYKCIVDIRKRSSV
uniref:Pumilio/Puf RNA-binding domain-containing protein n=1 Tax=Musa acuminata TaxID=4641 RepID=Q1EP01_MUSAC|nr:pumilio/Puf RNA-binding domain-containing protein [Musa acuminata]